MSTDTNTTTATGPLAGVKILDLSRIVAGPSCTQILGDLGADIIKVERPVVGDDVRTWGPPFLQDDHGENTTESGYYLSVGRNKKSIALDFSKPEGKEILLELLDDCDILVENYRVGSLKKMGLDYDSVKAIKPGIVYCSITGYGQTGPYAPRPGYDMAAQSLGGLISLIGEEGQPAAKVPIAIDDLMTGMYACIGILAALRHRDLTGVGQQIDLGLLDVQVGWLYNQAVGYFIDGKIPEKLGTGHPSIVPYRIFEASDGQMLLGTATDEQFEKFCKLAGCEELLTREGFQTGSKRVLNRAEVNAAVAVEIAKKPVDWWVDELSKLKVTCSKVNNMQQVFEDPQVQARGMKIQMQHPLKDKPVDLIANPINLSETPVSYRIAPPTLGQHTAEVLTETLGLTPEKMASLRDKGII